MKPIIYEAYAPLQDTKFIGRPVETQIIDKVVILVLKDIFHISNRKTANFLSVFSPVSEISVSYSFAFIYNTIHSMRQPGFEPGHSAWEADILPG